MARMHSRTLSHLLSFPTKTDNVTLNESVAFKVYIDFSSRVFVRPPPLGPFGSGPLVGDSLARFRPTRSEHASS